LHWQISTECLRCHARFDKAAGNEFTPSAGFGAKLRTWGLKAGIRQF
jgi:hypothetical protein